MVNILTAPTPARNPMHKTLVISTPMKLIPRDFKESADELANEFRTLGQEKQDLTQKLEILTAQQKISEEKTDEILQLEQSLTDMKEKILAFKTMFTQVKQEIHEKNRTIHEKEQKWLELKTLCEELERREHELSRKVRKPSANTWRSVLLKVLIVCLLFIFTNIYVAQYFI
ncbi:hypothetical protein K493DRAFT_313042 [Basidiobolus meristosporus CBS 931.73]|uniref:Uncharacterized protein n=1 Tax=Basidiobolus meristosporus CBS 931.73 TaxID=1314790 RepID=A0A1Y1YP99_9FUNG|nr:hypothetical protein K493DRAFT_313042 [Basidiobolus meristosporus CBS 931.73]|eukprot:ORX99847.1 hypothetical protein K493DRAFT_313042 [Basidiobolus meristosporus CBS 931.73]